MERRYVCKNGIVERVRWYAGDNTRLHGWRKAKTHSRTPEEKQQDNQRAAIRELARLLNCNGETGCLVTLTYSPEAHDRLYAGMTEDEIREAARKQSSLYLRRLKRKAGADLKIVSTESDREELEDGTLEPCQIHHHLVVMGDADPAAIRAAWGNGFVDVQELYQNQEDRTPLAAYLLRQVRRLPGKKSYCCTRNLEKPQIQDRVVVADPGDEIRVQPGAKVLDRSPYRAGSVQQYVRYKKAPPRKKRGGHKEPEPEGGAGVEFSKAPRG